MPNELIEPKAGKVTYGKDDFSLHHYNTIAENGWSNWLAVEENKETLQILRRNVEKGLPCGNDVFIEQLEKYSNKSMNGLF